MKKYLLPAILIVFIIVLAIPAFAAKPVVFSISASASTFFRGDTFTVTVSTSEVENCYSGGYLFSYNADVFEYISGTALLSGYTMSGVTDMSGHLSGYFAGGDGTVQGAVFEVTFKVKEDAPYGTYSITGSPSMTTKVADIKENLSCSTGSATITVSCKHIYGEWVSNEAQRLRSCLVCSHTETEFINYTITFKDWDGAVLSSKTYHWGQRITPPANPTRASDEIYSYAFKDWNKTVVNCAGDATYTATYSSTYRSYTVTFKDWDGKVLASRICHWDQSILLPPNPTKPQDDTFTYRFTDWDHPVVNCAGDATYTATYESVYRDYTVVFQDWNGEVLSSNFYHWGDIITAPPTPTRASDEAYTYTFADWDKSITPCAGNELYTATYTRQRNDGLLCSVENKKVTITGYAGNGEHLTIPKTIDGMTVTSIADQAFSKCTQLVRIELPDSITSIGSSAFEGCSSLNAVNIPNKVTSIQPLTFSGCTALTSVTIGNKVAVIGVSAFSGCSSLVTLSLPESIEKIDSTAFYNCAALKEITIPSTVIAIDNHAFAGCTGLSAVTYCGTEQQWKAIVKDGNELLTGALQLHKFTNGICSICKHRLDYKITFLDWDGTVLSTLTCHYGDKVSAPPTPARAADSIFTYTFKGWDKTVVKCTGDATYTATYDQSYIDYTVVFYDWNGDVLSGQSYHYGDTPVTPPAPCDWEDHTYVYTFACWDKEIVACSGDACYTATYSKHRKVMVGDINGDSTVTQEDVVHLLLHTMFGQEAYPVDRTAADADGNGDSNPDDVLYLLLHTIFGTEHYPLSAPTTHQKTAE